VKPRERKLMFPIFVTPNSLPTQNLVVQEPYLLGQKTRLKPEFWGFTESGRVEHMSRFQARQNTEVTSEGDRFGVTLLWWRDAERLSGRFGTS